LVHDGTGARYTAATALIDDKYFTFSEHTFELVNSAERKKD